MPVIDIKERTAFTYQRPGLRNGYNDQTLYVNLSDGSVAVRPVQAKTKETFIGGKGYDLWLLFQAVTGQTRWDDPANELCIASGPLGGTPIYPGSGKSIVTTISPATGIPIDSNVGGYFGP
jgi:aldehyde:ferredoxin oxidoreductase